MSKPTMKNARHSAAESTDQARVIPRAGNDCPDWCTDHSPFGGEPISEAYPGIHQSENLAVGLNREVRLEQGVDEPVRVVAISADYEIYVADPDELRDLGRALISAADLLEIEVARRHVPLRDDMNMPEVFALALSIGIRPSSLVAAHEAVVTQ